MEEYCRCSQLAGVTRSFIKFQVHCLNLVKSIKGSNCQLAKGEEAHRKPLARLPRVLYDRRLIFEMPALLSFDKGKMTSIYLSEKANSYN